MFTVYPHQRKVNFQKTKCLMITVSLSQRPYYVEYNGIINLTIYLDMSFVGFRFVEQTIGSLNN